MYFWSYYLRGLDRVLWMSLAVALIVSLVLIVWPLRILTASNTGKKKSVRKVTLSEPHILHFFFLEIAFMHQFVLFLSQSMIAMAGIVPPYLIFARCDNGVAFWMSMPLPLELSLLG